MYDENLGDDSIITYITLQLKQ